jgi:site-specific DNA recombinase
VLMSFAQFERENTAERIRDKIAASKKRGMWMGGPLPFGYVSRDRQLVQKPPEARIVRLLFKRFIELGSVQRLSEETRASSSLPDFAKSRLYKMFSNPIYIGKVRHKGEVYDGLHKAIVDEITWAKVQAILAKDSRKRAARTRARTPALLKGLLFGPDGAAMSPSHTCKGQKRYRYYVSQTVIANGAGTCPIGRISAAEIEELVLERIKGLLCQPEIIFSACRASKVIGLTLTDDEIADLIRELTPVWENLFPDEQARLVNLLVERVMIHLEHVEITLRLDGLQRLAGEIREAA